ncbi:MAG: hypothetical protein IIA36_12580, partial [Proteobacteria bacterium]|nr:hypothetical protein [Pseudomonadota bacterium]
MLEMFMFATEPFGTWGPGPIPEPVGRWARFLDSITNDPQAVATIIAAFLGFLSGVLIKYGLDRHAERLRRETDRRMLATALRGELLNLELECGRRIDEYEKLLNEKPEKEVFGGPHSFARMALPPRRVWMAHLGRIGELEGVDPESLILVHSSFDSHDLVVETLKQRAGGQGHDQAHRHGRRALASIRMSDVHHASGLFAFMAPAILSKHPEWRIVPQDGTQDVALDYSHDGVRNHRLAIIEEILATHLVDGIQLDFMRSCRYFPSHE